MKSIYKYVYAAVLVFSALNFAPTHASAQDEGGTFKLPHEVRWQNVVVPPGDYKFSLQPMGPTEILKLVKVSGKPASFMLLVNDIEEGSGSETARLVIDSRFGATYVKAMELPFFEITLHFAMPTSPGKEVAVMHAATVANSIR